MKLLERGGALALLNKTGNTALYTKRQGVRFLQNNISTYQDIAWGAGNLFSRYKCAAGSRVDFYEEGYFTNILISIRATKNAGDIEEFHIERGITDGFVKGVREIQTLCIQHRMHSLTMSIIFPVKRLPKSVLLIEQNIARTTPLGRENIKTLPDGRVRVVWNTNRVRLFEAYLLRWEWRTWMVG